MAHKNTWAISFTANFLTSLATPSYSENLDGYEARRIQEIIDYQDGILFGQSDFIRKKKNLDSGNDQGHEIYDPWMDEAITTTSNEGFWMSCPNKAYKGRFSKEYFIWSWLGQKFSVYISFSSWSIAHSLLLLHRRQVFLCHHSLFTKYFPTDKNGPYVVYILEIKKILENYFSRQ